MTDEPTTQAAIDEAAEAPARMFHGIKLQPFSFQREACWRRCRLEGYGDEYEGAVFLVFISTLGDEIVEGRMTGKDLMDSARGRDGILSFHRRVGAWANEHGLHAHNSDGVEVMRIADEIWKEMEASTFRIVSANGSESPNA